MTIIKPIVAFFITFVIGAILSILITVTEANGYFEKWHRLPLPPATPNELTLGRFGNIYIQTEGGRFFICEHPSQENCWTISNPPNSAEADPYVNECMNYSFHVVDPPFVVVQQLDWRSCQIEGWSLKLYALTDKQEIWQWTHGTLAQATILAIVLGCIASLLIGIIIALVIFLYLRRSLKYNK